ncbi:hypothetical protein BABINDRAFT_163459 [Babjeviella inositovora NRRL Y-12698]|uniref:F-box domain-containing protein n=1 Tax=Babjeviella inositovora NRRL Y-12698 TaxID=984486 RepID=A0A1E3QKA9_9ASCO|nr:uncharacterized protein BABINDRAFT_163459 [Babjeviella inositovora NRRL Y-12698]ODQ77437.1 hypothetical protein BABINDRAFT_163459 [Babjeviella inositovora NRRL Y-12698]
MPEQDFEVLRFIKTLPEALISRVFSTLPVAHIEAFFHHPQTRALARTRYYADVVLDMYDEATDADEELVLKMPYEEFFDLLDAKYELMQDEEEDQEFADAAIQNLEVRFFGTFEEFSTLFEDHVVVALNHMVEKLTVMFKVGLGKTATTSVDFSPFTCLHNVWMTKAEDHEAVDGTLMNFGGVKKLTFDEGVIANTAGLSLPASLIVLEVLNFGTLTIPESFRLPVGLKSLEMIGQSIDGFGNLVLPSSLQNFSLSLKKFSELLPVWTFAYPSSLRTLALDGNGITELAPLGIERLPALVQHISLSHNKLSSVHAEIKFPESLRVLNLSNNEITSKSLKRKLRERFTAKVYFDEIKYYDEAYHEQFY